jgi:hypothetical protein
MFISELDPADPRASTSDAITKSDAIFKRAKDAVDNLKALMAELEAARPRTAEYKIERGQS